MKNITLKESVFLLSVLLAIFGICIIGFELPPQIPILIIIGIIFIFAKIKGVSWDIIHKGIENGIKPGLIPIFIFMLIGALVSVWIASGTIPTIMIYGFKILSPKLFLPSVFVISFIVGIVVSSFTTISTVGIALSGMGQLMGFDPALTAGAIVSGAYLGHNVSPLADTTSLASALAEIDMFEHIANLMKTAIPTFIISLVFFMFFGHSNTTATGDGINQLVNTLSSTFHISIVTLLPLLVMFIFSWKKVPAIPTLLVSIAVSVGIIYLNNPHLSFLDLANLIQDGYVSKTGVKSVDSLLTRGGIQSMMWSVSLIFLALSLGGLLVELKVIDTLIKSIRNIVNTKGKLILTTTLTCIGVNVMVGEQYLSMILPGRAFKKQYDAINLQSKELSSVLANAGAAINPLIPWGVSGVFIKGALGISTMDYFPFAISCIVAFVLNIILGFIIPNKEANYMATKKVS
ncbi:Na+/H+ antiporter NhaC [Cytobacillus sp. Hz8]|uniref:Na+/H+ antiporter NhaC n=1 Tax=Cytobacillus sp. Hz8 TaxID=3347168 RepID=UPI0035DC2117